MKLLYIFIIFFKILLIKLNQSYAKIKCKKFNVKSLYNENKGCSFFHITKPYLLYICIDICIYFFVLAVACYNVFYINFFYVSESYSLPK